ncbi:MAG: hypothetical protein K9G49_14460 [Taibaiella sp.]|nr:hypothetical protein [Taibaiella sp.]
MRYTNFKWNKPIFHQAAKYRCINCAYSCEVYSNFEWVESYIDDCHQCGAEQVAYFGLPVFLYRSDCYPTLSIDPATLPDEKAGCAECPHVKAKGGKFHWTELEITCWECEGGGMKFEEFIEGIRMDEFIEIAIEESKLKAPDIGYSYFVNGHEYYVGSTHNVYIEEFADQKQIVKANSWEFKFSAT